MQCRAKSAEIVFATNHWKTKHFIPARKIDVVPVIEECEHYLINYTIQTSQTQRLKLALHGLQEFRDNLKMYTPSWSKRFEMCYKQIMINK